ncbi:unnamed protein product [Amoebophrya sp. A120]|nr:unnamed protein product [Amoebophrya sp. A120]|eukprot:GSA120T00021501001.1
MAAGPPETSQQNAPPKQDQKVVGPDIYGAKETYQLIRSLQAALFGGVYEAKGCTTGRSFAVKVLHKSELSKSPPSLDFCEVPLSEIRFEKQMRGHEHIVEVHEAFEDEYCHYIVFELAAKGDLLEALKTKPDGFPEQQCRFLMRQAALGLAALHDQKMAMQDVSLENLLIFVYGDTVRIKICDPGQAVEFALDEKTQEEKTVPYKGLVGKSFRPPELSEKRPYLATKVDSWCLGWSTFYLLSALPLFLSADSAQRDQEYWQYFRRGDLEGLFRRKNQIDQKLSPMCLDFIVQLMKIEPSKRISVHDSLKHPWLAGEAVPRQLTVSELDTIERKQANYPRVRNADHLDAFQTSSSAGHFLFRPEIRKANMLRGAGGASQSTTGAAAATTAGGSSSSSMFRTRSPMPQVIPSPRFQSPFGQRLRSPSPLPSNWAKRSFSPMPTLGFISPAAPPPAQFGNYKACMSAVKSREPASIGKTQLLHQDQPERKSLGAPTGLGSTAPRGAGGSGAAVDAPTFTSTSVRVPTRGNSGLQGTTSSTSATTVVAPPNHSATTTQGGIKKSMHDKSPAERLPSTRSGLLQVEPAPPLSQSQIQSQGPPAPGQTFSTSTAGGAAGDHTMSMVQLSHQQPASVPVRAPAPAASQQNVVAAGREINNANDASAAQLLGAAAAGGVANNKPQQVSSSPSGMDVTQLIIEDKVTGKAQYHHQSQSSSGGGAGATTGSSTAKITAAPNHGSGSASSSSSSSSAAHNINTVGEKYTETSANQHLQRGSNIKAAEPGPPSSTAAAAAGFWSGTSTASSSRSGTGGMQQAGAGGGTTSSGAAPLTNSNTSQIRSLSSQQRRPFSMQSVATTLGQPALLSGGGISTMNAAQTSGSSTGGPNYATRGRAVNSGFQIRAPSLSRTRSGTSGGNLVSLLSWQTPVAGYRGAASGAGPQHQVEQLPATSTTTVLPEESNYTTGAGGAAPPREAAAASSSGTTNYYLQSQHHTQRNQLSRKNSNSYLRPSPQKLHLASPHMGLQARALVGRGGASGTGLQQLQSQRTAAQQVVVPGGATNASSSLLAAGTSTTIADQQQAAASSSSGVAVPPPVSAPQPAASQQQQHQPPPTIHPKQGAREIEVRVSLPRLTTSKNRIVQEAEHISMIIWSTDTAARIVSAWIEDLHAQGLREALSVAQHLVFQVSEVISTDDTVTDSVHAATRVMDKTATVTEKKQYKVEVLSSLENQTNLDDNHAATSFGPTAILAAEFTGKLLIAEQSVEVDNNMTAQHGARGTTNSATAPAAAGTEVAAKMATSTNFGAVPANTTQPASVASSVAAQPTASKSRLMYNQQHSFTPGYLSPTTFFKDHTATTSKNPGAPGGFVHPSTMMFPNTSSTPGATLRTNLQPQKLGEPQQQEPPARGRSGGGRNAGAGGNHQPGATGPAASSGAAMNGRLSAANPNPWRGQYRSPSPIAAMQMTLQPLRPMSPLRLCPEPVRMR